MQKNKAWITYFSIGMNVFLSAMKLIVSFITGSTAILSEALHSGSDLITSFIAMFAVRESEKPPDREHPYGHGKFENVGSLLEAIIIFASGVFIFYRSISQIILGSNLGELDLGICVMLVSAVINFFVSSFLIRKGKELESPAIEADGWHSRTDVFTAGGVMLSLIIVKITGIKILDPIIALLVGLVIFWISIRIFLESYGILVDKSLPPEEEAKIKEIIKLHSDQYLEFHKMRTRKKGGERELDLHLVFPISTSLKDAHDLSTHLEEEIRSVFPHMKILIHMEPCDRGENIEFECKSCCGHKSCVFQNINKKKIGDEIE